MIKKNISFNSVFIKAFAIILIVAGYFSIAQNALGATYSNFTSNINTAFNTPPDFGFTCPTSNFDSSEVTKYWYSVDGGTPVEYVGSGQPCFANATFSYDVADIISVSGIPPGEHTVRIMFDDDTPDSSSDYFQVDVFDDSPYLSFLIPEDEQTLPDFQQWRILWQNLDTASANAVLGIHWGTDEATVIACEDFPSGSGAGYTECINGSPNINVDYSAIYSSGIWADSSSAYVLKSNGAVLGQTYYAQVVLQENDAFGSVLYASDVIEFTIGVAEEGGGIPIVSCSTFDIFCHLKNFASWMFTVPDSTLQSFSALTLENSLPFSYLYDVGNLYDELFANSGSMEYAVSANTGAFGEIDFISASQISAVPFASTIKTILGYLMYFFTAMTLYRMLLRSHSQNHA